MFVLLAVVAIFTGVGVFLTERVDRPLRRAARFNALPAE